jgi:cytochrome c2
MRDATAALVVALSVAAGDTAALSLRATVNGAASAGALTITLSRWSTDAEAEALLTRACTACHDADRFNKARFNPDRWRVVIVEMREKGAEIEDEELERLVEWLGRTKGANQ